MKTIYLITGGTGFVGNNLIKILEEKGEMIVTLAQNEAKVKKALKDTKAKVIYGDIRNAADIENLFSAADKLIKEDNNLLNEDEVNYILIHAASIVRIGGTKNQYKEMTTTNRLGTQNVVNACIKHHCRLLYVSSIHAITELKKRALIKEIEDYNPETVVGKYAKSKAEASAIVMKAVREQSLDAVLVHPTGITGPNDWSNSHLTQMVADYIDGKIPAATSGGYDFVDVRDVAFGIIAAAENGKTGDRFILGNTYYSVRCVLNTLYEITKTRKIKVTLPIFLAQLGLPFLWLYSKIFNKRPLYTSYSLYTLGSNSNFSHEKAEKELGYKPRELKESLADTVAFLKEQRAKK